MDFCTVGQVKAWLKINSATDDELLQMLITQTTEYIRSLMSRDLDSRDYVETRDGNGANTLMVANWPVTAVAAVVVAGTTIPETEYMFDALTITLLNGRIFTRGRKNINIIYTAGYDTLPADLQRCCMEMVGKKYRERDRIGINSKTLAGEIVSYSQSDLTSEVKSVLRQYQRVTPI